MKHFLHIVSIIVSFVNAFRSHAGELYHARFARLHELTDLLTDSLPTDSLLLGIS